MADGLAGKRTLDEQIRSEQFLVAASQGMYDLAEQRFREGVADNLTLLDAAYAVQRAADVGAYASGSVEQPYRALQGSGRRVDREHTKWCGASESIVSFSLLALVLDIRTKK